MEPLEQLGTAEGGNTSSPSARKIKARAWCFTLNNYNGTDLEQLEQRLRAKGGSYVIGKEVGDEGTPHLQGYVQFKNPVHFTSMKKIMERAHLEKAKGSPEQNFEYCTKQHQYVTNMPMNRDVLIHQCRLRQYENIVWKSWQQDIINMCKEPAGDHCRKVWWYWSNAGDIGKTFIARYLIHFHGAIMLEGGSRDIACTIAKEAEKGNLMPVIVIDVVRDQFNHVSYKSIERIKNGVIYSGKYESGMVELLPAHVIVFANAEPRDCALSPDRWVVINVDEE